MTRLPLASIPKLLAALLKARSFYVSPALLANAAVLAWGSQS